LESGGKRRRKGLAAGGGVELLNSLNDPQGD